MPSTQVVAIRKTIKLGKKTVQRLAALLQKPKSDVTTLVQQISAECAKLQGEQAVLNSFLNLQSEESVVAKAARRLGKKKAAAVAVEPEKRVCARCGHSKAEHDRHGCGHSEKSDNVILGCECPEYTPKESNERAADGPTI